MTLREIHNETGTIRAVFSENCVFRYELVVDLTPDADLFTVLDKPVVSFLMLNPSTAGSADPRQPGGVALDPTVKRCCSFARGWGYRVLRVYNLFALVSPYPQDLESGGVNVVGPLNDQFLEGAAGLGGPIVCGWGAFRVARPRAAAVYTRLESLAPGRFRCLGCNADGSPRHPLYLASSTPLEHWSPPTTQRGQPQARTEK